MGEYLDKSSRVADSQISSMVHSLSTLLGIPIYSSIPRH